MTMMPFASSFFEDVRAFLSALQLRSDDGEGEREDTPPLFLFPKREEASFLASEPLADTTSPSEAGDWHTASSLPVAGVDMTTTSGGWEEVSIVLHIGEKETCFA